MGLDIYFTRKKTNEIGYFRKVNFLVKYFENKGMGVENQHPLEIFKEDAEELAENCRKVLENHDLAEELLPTREGFFFGPTEYDDWYFECVQDVLNFVEDELLPEFNELDSNESIYFEIWY